MSIQNDIRNQLLFIAQSPQLDVGVDATYYPARLTGYNVATSERTPSEETGVVVRGYFGSTRRRTEDGIVTTDTTFTIPAADGGTLVPKPFDRFTATRDGVERSYTVTRTVPLAGGVSAAGYQLIVEQA